MINFLTNKENPNIGLILIICMIAINVILLIVFLFVLFKKSKIRYIDNDTSKYDTKYPILLVHGMLLKDFKLYRAFRKIKDVLIDNKVNIYVSNIDGIGPIETNALQLKDEILAILKKENIDKINIIAHSKGGLDSRYAITKLDMEDHIASLTTLSTPHHGSKLSRKLLTLPNWFKKFLAFFINLFYKICKDKNPDILKVGLQLTDENMEIFNQEITNSDKVIYQSYSSSLNENKLFILKIPNTIIYKIENDENDGIVSLNSSMWGEYKGEMPKGIDHAKMVGAYGTYKSLNEISKFYLKIVSDLKNMNL